MKFVLLGLTTMALLLQAQPLYDPFVKTTKIQKKTSEGALLPPPPIIPHVEPISVTAVMNEKAFINGKWFSVGDRFRNQEVAFIQPNCVGLKENNRLTMISVGNQRRVLSTKETP